MSHFYWPPAPAVLKNTSRNGFPAACTVCVCTSVVTINDWPDLSNLSGQTNKRYNACTHCFDDLDSIYLKKCRKVVYLGYRRFLSMNHLVRKKEKHFKGKADHRCKPRNRTREDVFEMVKDVKVVFGKGQGSQPVPKDAAGHAPM